MYVHVLNIIKFYYTNTRVCKDFVCMCKHCVCRYSTNMLRVCRLICRGFGLYALAVWGPSVKVNLSSCLHHLYNRAVRITCGLWKYGYVSDSLRTLGWLLLDSLVKHRVLNSICCHFTDCDCVVFNPPIQFGSSHSYHTRSPSYFCCAYCCKASFGQCFFWNESY